MACLTQKRLSLTLALAALAGGCASPPLASETIWGTPVPVALAGASLGSIIVLERGLFDVAYSLITGKDCSIVHIERRGEYCRTEAADQPTPFCTRSLGDVDCWTVTNPYGGQLPVADRPMRAERQARPWSLSPF
jgi:hypothetical protein